MARSQPSSSEYDVEMDEGDVDELSEEDQTSQIVEVGSQSAAATTHGGSARCT